MNKDDRRQGYINECFSLDHCSFSSISVHLQRRISAGRKVTIIETASLKKIEDKVKALKKDKKMLNRALSDVCFDLDEAQGSHNCDDATKKFYIQKAGGGEC